MATDVQIAELVGTWSGPSQLWLMPGEPAQESRSTAQIGLVAQGQFGSIAYTWAYEGQPQDGIIICALGQDSSQRSSVWLDSWHMANQIMQLRGSDDSEMKMALHGSYAAPPGPDWGWRIEIEPHDRNSWTLRMYNVSPEGEDHIAVLAKYERELS